MGILKYKSYGFHGGEDSDFYIELETDAEGNKTISLYDDEEKITLHWTLQEFREILTMILGLLENE